MKARQALFEQDHPHLAACRPAVDAQGVHAAGERRAGCRTRIPPDLVMPDRELGIGDHGHESSPQVVRRQAYPLRRGQVEGDHGGGVERRGPGAKRQESAGIGRHWVGSCRRGLGEAGDAASLRAEPDRSGAADENRRDVVVRESVGLPVGGPVASLEPGGTGRGADPDGTVVAATREGLDRSCRATRPRWCSWSRRRRAGG